jgi:hypothetical protein
MNFSYNTRINNGTEDLQEKIDFGVRKDGGQTKKPFVFL